MAERTYRDKTVVVTGAAGGLGRALCHAFAGAGARIGAIDRDAAGLARLASELPAVTVTHACDITDETAVARCFSAIGPIDVLINNAGISHRSAFATSAPEVIRRVMAVNFFGAVHCTHAALPDLIARRGQIIAVSSVAGFSPLIARTGYSASKHALHGFFDSLRSEVGGSLDILIACPSFIRTGIDDAALGGAGGTADRPRQTTGDEATPAEVAQRILAAARTRQRLLLPSRTAWMAWWISRLQPDLYAHLMKRRLGAEMATGTAENHP